MRLAVLSPFVDRRHGTERAVAELVERLARDYRCEIHLFAQRVEDLRIADSEAPPREGEGRILWHRVPSLPGPHLLQFLGWLFLNSLWRRGWSLVHGAAFDLLVSPGINCLHPDAVIVHAVFGRLQLLSSEENASVSAPRRMHRGAYYRLLKALERHIYGNPKVALAAVSRRTAGLLEQYFGRQDVCVIRNAVDTNTFSPSRRLARRKEARREWSLPENSFVVLLIGNDWRVKGLATMIQAVAALRDLPLEVLVVGDDDRRPYEDIAGRLGVRERLHWAAPRSDVLSFYAAADAYASPTQEDSFGLPVAEAMACGLPVITSSSAGVAELIQDGVDGFILREPSDARALAEMLQQLFTDAELRQRMGANAAQTALPWTWNQNAAETWQFLKDALARKRSFPPARSKT